MDPRLAACPQDAGQPAEQHSDAAHRVDCSFIATQQRTETLDRPRLTWGPPASGPSPCWLPADCLFLSALSRLMSRASRSSLLPSPETSPGYRMGESTATIAARNRPPKLPAQPELSRSSGP